MVSDKTDLGWFVVDIVGHSRVAGQVSKPLEFAPLWQIDIVTKDEPMRTQWFAPSAIHRMYPVSQELAIKEASAQFPPFHPYNYPPSPDEKVLREVGLRALREMWKRDGCDPTVLADLSEALGHPALVESPPITINNIEQPNLDDIPF